MSTAAAAEATKREAEPHRLVQQDQRWRLLAFDPDRGDWRTFRLDPMRVKPYEGGPASPRVRLLTQPTLLASTDAFSRRHRATVLVEAPMVVVPQRLPPAVPVERVDDALRLLGGRITAATCSPAQMDSGTGIPS